MPTTSRSPVLALGLLWLGAQPLSAAEATVAANRPATVVTTVTPAYPYLMRRAEARAEVTVTFTVNTRGMVTKADVIDTNNPEFNAATLDAIRQWVFAPAIKDGRAVETKLRQTFTFSVQDKSKTGTTPVTVADQKAR
jgi:TonB family protein